MKIALINIPDSGISGKGYTVPLGLAYIGSAIRNAGYEVKAFDLSVSKNCLSKYYLKADEPLLNELGDYNPGFIGMTCTTTNRINVAFWAEVLKKRFPSTTILVGGPHPFFLPESYLSTNPSVDVLVLGEGETTIVDYLHVVSRGQDLETVKGIAFQGKAGTPIVNQQREAIENLDLIAFPARDLFPMQDYDIKFGTISEDTATMITSRGCGNTCKFCSTTRYWRKVRFRSAKNIVDEIEDIIRQFPFIRNVVFFDDTFTANRRHALSVCEEIIARRIKINWGCWSRTNIIDRDYLAILRESGCTTLSFGIESGNDEMLRVIRKNSTVQKNYEALTLPAEFGIECRGTMIAGMPEEKFGWAIDSLLFMARTKNLSPEIQISLKTFIFPGTHWEHWFRQKYKDFSWENIPSRFRKGSISDSFGNITLPCYRWGGVHYMILFILRKLIVKSRLARKLLSYPSVQNIIKKAAYSLFREYPMSIYDE